MRALLLACLAVFGLAGATVPSPTAQSVLAKAKVAMGGSAWHRITSLRQTGALETSGLQGTVEIIENMHSGAHVTRYDLGAMRGSEGADGHTVWLVDATGQTFPQGDGAKRREAANAVYLACRGYWFPQRWPADVAWMGRREEQERAFEVLQITPRGGQPFEFWVDAKTGFLDRTVDFKDGETDTTRFADYREVQGVKLPFEIREGDGEAQFDAVIRLAEITVNPHLTPQAFAMPKPSSKGFGFDPGQTITTLPMELDADGHIYLQATLEGKGPFWFCLDSGVEGSLLTSAMAKQLGLRAEGAVAMKGVGAATESASCLTVHRAQIHGAWMEGLTFAVSPAVARIGEVHGEPCAGIFGSDLLQRFVVRLDYAAHRLSLFPREGWRYGGRGTAVPFFFRGQMPQVEGALDGLQGTFAIDTGSGGTLDVYAPFVAAHALIAKAGLTYPNPAGDGGFGGREQSRKARFRTLRLGGASMTRPIVGLSLMSQGAFASQSGLGNVGAGFFKRFTVTFDYSRQKIYFEPNANHDAPDRFGNTHGLRGLEGDQDGFRITDLLQPSPLSEAGIKVGDVIVAINRKSGKDLTPAVLGEALGAPVGTSLKMDIRAEGKVRQVTLTLRDLL